MLVKVVLFITLAVVAMSAPQKLLVDPVDVQQEWANWKTENKKTYGTPEEETKRFQIFQENIKKIADHNKKFEAGEVTWSQGLNHFADLSQEEFSNTYLGLRRPEDAH